VLVARASASVSVTRSQLTAVHDHRETTTYRALSCERARGGSAVYRCVTHTMPDAFHSTADAHSSDASSQMLPKGQADQFFLPMLLPSCA